MRVLRHGDIYAILNAIKRMHYYIVCFRQQFPVTILKLIKRRI